MILIIIIIIISGVDELSKVSQDLYKLSTSPFI